MTKQSVQRQLESSTGMSFLSISDIARCLGTGRDTARELMCGADYLPSGRAKRFHVSDIAERIVARRLN